MSAVRCVECAAEVPAREADLTGRGAICRACGVRREIDIHEGADDAIGHLDLDEMRARARALKWAFVGTLAIGVVGTAGLVIVLATGLVENPPNAVFIFPACIAGALFELFAWRRARRAVALMTLPTATAAPTSRRARR